ncbi:MAG: acyl-CoA dehydrogenase [Deltaproteobacteria bacterium CG11_big_fil_rev_8_21_14_0_20_45_16]|nr:MAG: acyl-CoA dehydrogenase [Deltaproteobacteria bacterium CG11_big_fil_rev_8_21_14_0_20_45_16]
MNFELSDDHKAIRQLARNFSESDLKETASKWDQEKKFPHELVPKLAELGFMGMSIPEEYGGSDLDLLSCAIVMEEVARHCGSTALTLASHNGLGSKHILEFGNEAQKKKYLPDIAAGKKLSAWALTEPGSGSDASGMKTVAVEEKDCFVLNGSKAFITQGSVGDVYLVLAKTSPEKRQKGVSAFIIEKGTPGFTPGKPEDKLGCRGSDTSTLSLDNVRVPKENLVGERDMGFIDTLKILDKGRVIIGAMALGLGRGALEESIRYAKEREQFGQPIANFQAIQWKLANMATELEAARLLLYRACYLHREGRSINTEASMAKLFASEAGLKACDEAIQIHGGYGYIKDYPVERYWRDCRICTIGEGTSEVQRMIISRNILRGQGG